MFNNPLTEFFTPILTNGQKKEVPIKAGVLDPYYYREIGLLTQRGQYELCQELRGLSGLPLNVLLLNSKT